MPRRVPPFQPLLAFDAVVRHRSFTRAASELGVTQSAISHQVRRLEQHFGMPLLVRLNPGLELTIEGRALLPKLTAALDELGALDAHVRRAARQHTLRIGVGSALCNWWLIRRLPRFALRAPSVSLELVPLEKDGVAPRPVDIRIGWVPADEARRSSTQAPLFREQVFPVCAPSLLAQASPMPGALLSLPLIHKDADRLSEWSWDAWFARFGLRRADAHGRGMQVGDIGLCLAAAAEGGGVALGRSLLVSDAIADGRLAPLCPDGPMMPSSKTHVARWPAELSGDADVQTFVAWLADEATRTCAVPS
jgi:LysR family transcriptional regulator, glycine cleavage system transcriptional activator